MTRHYTVTIENDDYYCLATVQVDFNKIDDSIEHDFGVKRQCYYEPRHIEICSVIAIDGLESIDPVPLHLDRLIKEQAYRVATNG